MKLPTPFEKDGFVLETVGDLLIYADWLDENERGPEALRNRAVAHALGVIEAIAFGEWDGFLDQIYNAVQKRRDAIRQLAFQEREATRQRSLRPGQQASITLEVASQLGLTHRERYGSTCRIDSIADGNATLTIEYDRRGKRRRQSITVPLEDVRTW